MGPIEAAALVITHGGTVGDECSYQTLCPQYSSLALRLVKPQAHHY